MIGMFATFIHTNAVNDFYDKAAFQSKPVEVAAKSFYVIKAKAAQLEALSRANGAESLNIAESMTGLDIAMAAWRENDPISVRDFVIGYIDHIGCDVIDRQMLETYFTSPAMQLKLLEIVPHIAAIIKKPDPILIMKSATHKQHLAKVFAQIADDAALDNLMTLKKKAMLDRIIDLDGYDTKVMIADAWRVILSDVLAMVSLPGIEVQTNITGDVMSVQQVSTIAKEPKAKATCFC